ncbi:MULTISPECIES: hypothetical protein [Actinomycetes]|uniref:hypothetical protein n=1 Tax=Actinomycetes TaxID=1760 RepID=UPI0005277F26|nr:MULTISPECIES: hypothetical protein [Actinomycetes]
MRQANRPDAVRDQAGQSFVWQVQVKRRLTDAPGTEERVAHDLGIPVGMVYRLARCPYHSTVMVPSGTGQTAVTLSRAERQSALGLDDSLDDAIAACIHYDTRVR